MIASTDPGGRTASTLEWTTGEIRIHGAAHLPTVLYLPGLHGDWTLLHRFRECLCGRARLVEVIYPRWFTGTLSEQAVSLREALLKRGVDQVWILAESFGSQLAWALLDPGHPEPRFRVDGLVLAGGFVRHPWVGGVRLTQGICGRIPMRLARGILEMMRPLIQWRLGFSLGGYQASREFITRRTEEDRCAAVHRLNLIASTDLRPIAAATTLPVWYLTGFFDWVVPWPPVLSWLRQHCPGWRGYRVLIACDHAVLVTQPRDSAKTVLDWIKPP